MVKAPRRFSKKHYIYLVLTRNGVPQCYCMAKRKFDKKKVQKEIGLRVRKIRYQKGWTLEECEEYGGMNWRQLQAIESGANITIATLVKLSNLFGVHPIAFLED